MYFKSLFIKAADLVGTSKKSNYLGFFLATQKGSLLNDIVLRMGEGIWKILIFRKMADVEIQSCLFDQNFTHIFSYKKKKNRPKKNPSSIRRTIIYKISEKNFKLIGQAVLNVVITDFENMVSKKSL